jgi:hypothetical protein
MPLAERHCLPAQTRPRCSGYLGCSPRGPSGLLAPSVRLRSYDKTPLTRCQGEKPSRCLVQPACLPVRRTPDCQRPLCPQAWHQCATGLFPGAPGYSQDLPLKPLRPLGENCLTISHDGSLCTGFAHILPQKRRSCQGDSHWLKPLPALASAWPQATAALRASCNQL